MSSETTTPSNQKRQSSKSDMIAFACGCGKRIAAKREWAGRRVKCPGCGEAVKIPGGNKPKPESSAMDDLLDEVGVSRAAQRCPECKSDMKEGHVICIKCGYDVERGKRLKTKTYQSSARKLDMEAGVAEKKPNPVIKLVVGGILVAVLAAAALVAKQYLNG